MGSFVTIFMIIIFIPIYVYTSMVFSKLAKRTNTESAWLG